MQLNTLQKHAALRLFEGVEITQDASGFAVRFLTVVPFFKVTESFAFGHEVAMGRRDLKPGQQAALAVASPQRVEVTITWPAPNAGGGWALHAQCWREFACAVLDGACVCCRCCCLRTCFIACVYLLRLLLFPNHALHCSVPKPRLALQPRVMVVPQHACFLSDVLEVYTCPEPDVLHLLSRVTVGGRSAETLQVYRRQDTWVPQNTWGH